MTWGMEQEAGMVKHASTLLHVYRSRRAHSVSTSAHTQVLHPRLTPAPFLAVHVTLPCLPVAHFLPDLILHIQAHWFPGPD